MASINVALFYRDPQTRSIIETALTPPIFRLLAFDLGTGKPPSGIERESDVMLTEFDGGDEAEVRVALLRGMESLTRAPLIALGHGVGTESEALALTNGADAFVPVTADAALLRARIRAALRFSSRTHVMARRNRDLAGSLKDVEPLKLLKFCEDRRLSGRLTVKTPIGQRWVEFLGGELIQSGSDADDGQDPLDALLAAREGTYHIEQTPLELSSDLFTPVQAPPETQTTSQATDVAKTGAAAASPISTSGRLAIVREAPHRAPYHVQTEGENKPNFTVTTLVTQDGRVVRKTRTTWQHPLTKTEDRQLAQSQLDHQHERVVAKMHELAAAAEAPPQPVRPSGVNGLLLGWAMHFIVEQAWSHIGTAVTAAVLRRTHADLIARYPVLKLYRVWVEGRVDFDVAQGPTIPLDAIDAVATWSATFLTAAQKLSPEITRIKVRQATSLMEHALQQVGFYEAFDRAHAKTTAALPTA